ncbi:protein FAM32A [Halyomorpha halys]|uniref:protein FAM32A n=1 Tax=Halyomorpha halys TaxID=286706 RepID=UPI0006D4E9A6|nr:protein FAM32A [Halyomorpha halys]
MSEYQLVSKGALKLKGDGGIKKKKKDKKNKKKVEEIIEAEAPQVKKTEQLTKAEIAFLKMQEKVEKERIMKKASMTHKQRVEEFNKHLDSLTEHFDIPKVSWTK